MDDNRMTKLRERMVRQQISRRDIRDRRIIAAMRKIPRHQFIPEANRGEAYKDAPVAIGFDQTISQPYVVASMTEELCLPIEARVLEVGTGSGYQSAVLAELCKQVFTIERIEELHALAVTLLNQLGYENVTARIGNGVEGWPEAAPFDGIIVTAVASQIPENLVEQLKDGGRMVIPVQDARSEEQDLILVQKIASGFQQTKLYPVRFVPLVDIK